MTQRGVVAPANPKTNDFGIIDPIADSKAVNNDPTAMELESYYDDKSDINASNYGTIPYGSPQKSEFGNKEITGSRISRISKE